MEQIHIYKITNLIAGKSYIGWTSKGVPQRWRQHVRAATKGGDNRKFYNAIRKYGADVWDIIVLGTATDKAHACEIERKFIAEFNTYHNGYNSTTGGDGNRGMVMSVEANRKRSEALKGKPKPYAGMKGKFHSIESRMKISTSHLGKKKPWVKWSREQIEIRSFKRRCITKDQWNMIHELSNEGISKKEIAERLGMTYDMVKKWSRLPWDISI